ncbi:MAG: precorrin-8X methylmutase [Sporomusaceae bacterium]|jgi:precorrin-8X/cobalt-precorrin-8 methylmutase|nr:precorrin-8X methylmutase [Sporomusaceae bacterium]
MNFLTDPAEIEQKSLSIISEKLTGRNFAPENINMIKRVIHTTADFDYADNLFFSKGAAAAAKAALTSGANLVTDTQMAYSGINKKALAQLGSAVHCFISEPQVAASAKEKGTTRAWAAVEYAAKNLAAPLIFVVGNAPTALIRLYELIKAGEISPALIIAAPVGFVNVVESKELILTLPTPHIVAQGQKGGSNVAAAICNALMYEITERSFAAL